MKHTPGPWEVGGPYPGVSVIVCVDGGRGGPDPEPPTYEPIAILDQRKNGEQSKQALVDARLIAAAPELLAACKALLDKGPDCGCEAEGHVCGWPTVKQQAAAAIAKAEGTVKA